MVFVCLLISSSSLAVTAGFPLLAGGWWPVVGQRCATVVLSPSCSSGKMNSVAVCWLH